MKRCFSMALILAMLAATVLFPASAEAPETVSGAVDAEVLPAAEAGDTGLTIEETPLAPTETLIKEEAFEEVEIELGGPEISKVRSATSILLSCSTLSIGVKEKYPALTVIAQPDGSVVPEVRWRSSNTSRVKINSKTGVIKGVKKGSATIYATTANGLKAKCRVRVNDKPTGIRVEPSSKELSPGMSFSLRPTVTGGVSGRITYYSSKPSVATVDDSGTVVALKPGRVTVTARTYNGKKARCKINVLPEAASLVFPDDSFCIAIGKSAALTATALDASGNETIAAVTYAVESSSPDTGCIELNPDTGEITAVCLGQAVVTATTHNNIIASCNVVVACEPTGVRLTPDSVSIGEGEVFYGLMAELIAPEGQETAATTLTWISDNAGIATVDDSGVLTGVGNGACVVRVSTENDLQADCSVKVLKAPTGISIYPAVGALRVGKIGQYRITMFPSGSGGSLSYTSSDTSIATIDENGQVTARSAGVVDITVTTYNGKSATAQLVVSEGSGGGKAGETTPEKIKYLINLARLQLGKPYIYGGGYTQDEPVGFDCSSFVYWLYRHVDVTLQDTAYKQGYDPRFRRVSMEELQPGDVIYFNTNPSDGDLCDHSAFYIGNGAFIHASSSAKKVILSTLTSQYGYYNSVFSWGHRILE